VREDGAVPWRLTDDVEVYASHAWELLAADPAQHTVPLTLVESLRAGQRWSDERMVFGWYEAAGGVRGAVAMTPPFDLLLAAVPEDAIGELVAALRRERAPVPGVNGEPATVERFAAAWTAGTALREVTAMDLRLYGLDGLRPPNPPPAGRGRPAGEGDLELAVRWFRAYAIDTGIPAAGAERTLPSRIAAGRLWLWADEAGVPVSLAGRTPTAAGIARLAPVYTPPEHRRRGYGAAVTAACTADALRAGAEGVVLFTDLANPTSNAIYRQIGFRPLGDRRVVRFESR
jgi:predicted GNAT family acetyltransferase